MNQIEKLIILGEAAFGKSWKASLADAIPVARPTITDWIKGEKPIPVGIWKEIQRILADRKKEIDEAIVLINTRHLIILEEMKRKLMATTLGDFSDYLLELSDDEIRIIYAAYKTEYARCNMLYPDDVFTDLSTIKDALDFNFCIRNLDGNLDLKLAEDCALSFAKNKKLAKSFGIDDAFLLMRTKEIMEMVKNG
ncbi:helix-turn-helix domain-containing protein [Acinetobacter ursingii]|uniref:helix-turn-helix domain-containing protein n=1 Tax=Acinetobacter ursingii TaxID=108980 RepID=UPI0021E2D288|nr:helix-turn-helix domain-containing protein [Acinetobacter ursingii]UYF78225.1 helix-turn-helix domain-containing protein [Acinetobacter ursingii]